MKHILLSLVLVLTFSFSAFADKCVSGDCANGYGTYVWDNGDKYVGENKDNLSHGQGTYTFANGEKYEGEWKDDKRDGQGTYTFANGEIVHGIWENGKLIKEIEKKQDTNKIPPEIIIGAGS